MSLLYSRQISGEQRFVGFETNSQKLLVYQGTKDNFNPDDRKQYSIQDKMFTTECTIRSDLAPCGIAICSREVMLQFADNFDFQQLDDVIGEIVVKEDVLCQTINVELLPEEVVAFTALDYGSLLRGQRQLVQRWCYPFTYDRLPTSIFEDRVALHYHRNHVYTPRDEESPLNAEFTVLGRGCNIEKNVTMLDTTLGNNAMIKEGAVLRNVMAGNNFTLGNKSVIDGAIIGDNVTIGSNCRIHKKTIIGSGVIIPDNTNIKSFCAVMATAAPDDNDDLLSTREESW